MDVFRVDFLVRIGRVALSALLDRPHYALVLSVACAGSRIESKCAHCVTVNMPFGTALTYIRVYDDSNIDGFRRPLELFSSGQKVCKKLQNVFFHSFDEFLTYVFLKRLLGKLHVLLRPT